MRWDQISAGRIETAIRRIKTAMGNNADIIVNLLLDKDSSTFFEELERFFTEVVGGTRVVKSKSGLLENVGGALVGYGEPSGVRRRFVAKEHFRVNCSPTAIVPIRSMSDSFRGRFLCDTGVVESGPARYHINCANLLKAVDCHKLVRELGGENAAKMPLRFVWTILVMNHNNYPNMLIQRRTNIFFVVDQFDHLCAVTFDWDGRGWRIDAYDVGVPLDDVRGFAFGCQVFSADLQAEPSKDAAMS